MASRAMNKRTVTVAVSLTIAALLTACGGGSKAATPTILATATPSTAPGGSTANRASPTIASPSPSPTSAPAATPSSAPLAACAQGDVGAEASSQGATGSIAIIVVLSAASGPCHFDGSIVVTIEDANGNPQRVTGNGEATPLSMNLPGPVTLTWSNWCAAQVPFKADIRIGSKTVLAALSPPRCDNPTGPSKLALQPTS